MKYVNTRIRVKKVVTEQNQTYLKNYRDLRVVVLGATGFIGRWVARKLSIAGANLCLPTRDPLRAEKIFTNYGVYGKICQFEVSNRQTLRAVYEEFNPSLTFNLTGYGVDRSQQNEQFADEVNVKFVAFLCDLIEMHRDLNWYGQDLINTGTALEYGRTGGDLSEDSKTDPTTLYGRSKLAGTLEFAQKCRLIGLKGATARLFSVYGPGEAANRLLPTLSIASRTVDPVLLTEGKQMRDFVYVEDVAGSLLRLGLVEFPTVGIVNVATGKNTTVREFIETAANELGLKHERLLFGAIPTRDEEMIHEPVNNEYLRNLTGYVPNTTIRDGIRKTLSFVPLLRNINSVSRCG